MKLDSFTADGRLFLALSKRSTEQSCIDFTTLFKQGEFPKGVHIIREGEAFLILFSPTGRILASFHAGPGSVLGIPAVVGLGAPYTLTAVARKGSSVGFIETKEFLDLLAADPSLYPLVINLLSAEVRAARSTLAGQGVTVRFESRETA
jgi:CRP-like cAMP-binding protein